MKIPFNELQYGAHGRNDMHQYGVEVSIIPTGFVGEKKVVLSPIKKDGTVADGCRVSVRDTAVPDVCAAMLEIDPLMVGLVWLMCKKTVVTAEKYGVALPENKYVVRSVGRQVSVLESIDGNIIEVQNGTIKPV